MRLPCQPLVESYTKVSGLVFTMIRAFVFLDALPLLGKLMTWLGVTRFPQQCIQFYKNTGQMLIDDRKKEKNSKQMK